MRWHLLAALLIASTLFLAHSAQARDAAFMAPGSRFSGNATEVVTVEPKSEIKVGDTSINLGRRATFFFVNQTNKTVKIESIIATGDTNVKAEIVGDDCSSEKVIRASSRCSVTIEATPTAAGSWTAELLLTHNAQGRIARAIMTGKTSAKKGQAKDTGLSLSTKKIAPVDFGTVEVGTDKAVRSALMVNDSHTPITILDIEVIVPENGLVMAEQGCSIDMDLEVGESCPVTLIWKPTKRGIVSTDLIIRHSGRLGFAVIPIRGIAKGDKVKIKEKAQEETVGKVYRPSARDTRGAPTLSSTRTDADAVLKEMSTDNIAVSDTDLTKKIKTNSVHLDDYYLIGTVGSRAIIYQPDGTTVIVSEYDEIIVGDAVIDVISISPKKAVIEYLGKEKILKLTSATSLKRRTRKKKEISNSFSNSEDANEKAPTGARSNIVKLPVQK